MGYPTPDTLPTETIRRGFEIPSDPRFLACFMGALSTLCEPLNWELYGEVTPEDAAQAATVMFASMTEGGTGGSMPIGTVFPSVSDIAPEGCIPCDGSAYLESEYPELYAVIPSGFKTESEFIVPDLRGRTVIGAGMGDTLTQRDIMSSGGTEEHTLVVNELPSHRHSMPTQTTNVSLGGSGTNVERAGSGLNTGYVGGGLAHNNMQPWSALFYYIVAELA